MFDRHFLDRTCVTRQVGCAVFNINVRDQALQTCWQEAMQTTTHKVAANLHLNEALACVHVTESRRAITRCCTPNMRHSLLIERDGDWACQSFQGKFFAAVGRRDRESVVEGSGGGRREGGSR